MVIDSSALVAVLFSEPERRAFVEIMETTDACKLSVATFVEASIVLEAAKGPSGLRDLDRFMSRARIELVPVSIEQARLACDAFHRFGRGRHRAKLNLGDCFSYSLAMLLGEPLLCKGNDFIHTDVRIVPIPPNQ